MCSPMTQDKQNMQVDNESINQAAYRAALLKVKEIEAQHRKNQQQNPKTLRIPIMPKLYISKA